MISISNFSCGYNGKNILQNINLDIDSHLSILGVNGSGKSTLAKAVCGLIEFEGKIEIDSKALNKFDLKQKAKLISYVPSKLESYEGYITVFEFVQLSRFAYKQRFFEYTKEDRGIAQQSLKTLDILHLKDHNINSLSSGESALVLIASALTQQSDIIIFDEPTANLDPKNSKVIAGHIKELTKSHQIILITHDLHLACFIGSPVAFIKERSLLYFEDSFFNDDTLQELYGIEFQNMAAVYA